MNALAWECGIGELSGMLGVTSRAIRHYEDVGLVRPHRDRLNRRRYDAATRDRLERIALLRHAGIGIDEIRTILASGSDHDAQGGCVADAISARLRRIEAEVDRLRALLIHVRSPDAAALKLPPNAAVVATEAKGRIVRELASPPCEEHH